MLLIEKKSIACLPPFFCPYFFSHNYKKFPHSLSDGATQLNSKDVILMQNVPGEKTANGIKMVRFTRNDSCFLRLGELCEFQGIKTGAAPKQEETLEASRIHSSESCIRKSFINPIKLEKSPNLPQHLQLAESIKN